MSTRKITRTKYYIEHDGAEFEVPIEPVDGSEIVMTLRNMAVVGYLAQDDHGFNPRENDNLGTMVYWHRGYDLGDVDGRKEYGDVRSFLIALAGDHVDDIEGELDKIAEKHTKNRELEEEERLFLEKIIDEHYVMLPLALLDHSGLHMWVGSGAHPFDPGGWDSGQVGYIYVSAQKYFDDGPSPIGALHAIDKSLVTFLPLIKNEQGGWSPNPKGSYELHGAEAEKMLAELSEAFNKKELTPLVRQSAEACLEGEVEEFDKYLQGEVYGVCYATFKKKTDREFRDYETWEPDDREEVWGYIGHEYAEQELKSTVESVVKRMEEDE